MIWSLCVALLGVWNHLGLIMDIMGLFVGLINISSQLCKLCDISEILQSELAKWFKLFGRRQQSKHYIIYTLEEGITLADVDDKWDND